MPNKLTTKVYREKVKLLTHNKYTVLEEYVNTHTPILHKHSVCGHEFLKRPNSFLNGQHCPVCSKKKEIMKRTKTLKQYKQEVYNLVQDEYTIISNFYKTNKTKILHKHNTCGNTFNSSPNNFLYGRRCPICFGTKKRTTDEYKQEVYNLVQDEYTVLEEYINNDTPILHKHDTCGYKYYVRPMDFLKKKKPNRCPKCSNKISKGELKIMEFLNEKNIPFEYNVRYTEKISSEFRYITFDFKVFDNLFIEYDGRLHYEPYTKSQRSLTKFKNQQKRDTYKDKLSQDGIIELMRIPYWDYDNIKIILEERLNERN